jgi:hypothetical protein
VLLQRQHLLARYPSPPFGTLSCAGAGEPSRLRLVLLSSLTGCRVCDCSALQSKDAVSSSTAFIVAYARWLAGASL